MRHSIVALIIVAVACLSGCAKDRAQVAADDHARLVAARTNHEQAKQAIASAITTAQQMGDAARPVLGALTLAGAAIDRADVLTHNADLSLPAVADVPSSDYPAPTNTAEDLAKHPEVDVPAPEPSGMGKALAIASTLGLTALWIVGRVAPSFPMLGPAVGGIANALWSVAAHRDQKATDAVVSSTANAAQQVAPILEVIQSVPPDALPPAVRAVLTTERLDAARRLVGIVAVGGGGSSV